MGSRAPFGSNRQRRRPSIGIGDCQILGARGRQEDRALTCWCHGALLLAISDGMGGHPRGDEASAICIETLRAAFELAEPNEPEDWSRILHAAVACADDAVNALGTSLEGVRRPGATLVALLIVPRFGIWVFASVGDSYLYWARKDGEFARVNQLHENEEGRLTSYIGGGARLVDGMDTTMTLHPGDSFLLATNGLDVLSDTQIRRCFTRRNVRVSTIASSLLTQVEAKRHPEQDNATVLVARMPMRDP